MGRDSKEKCKSPLCVLYRQNSFNRKRERTRRIREHASLCRNSEQTAVVAVAAAAAAAAAARLEEVFRPLRVGTLAREHSRCLSQAQVIQGALVSFL